VLLVACGESTSTGGPDLLPVIGTDTTVVAFDATPLSFTGTDNRRTVDAQVQFPAEGAFRRVTLRLSLACPMGGCDWWDRFGTLGLVTARGSGGGPDTVVELARFITPYRVGGAWEMDLTALQPLLRGEATLRAFIDTWVGPGSSNGAGWLLGVAFEFEGGLPERLPIAVQPVWTRRSVPYGDPAMPPTGAAPPQTLTLPAGSTRELRSYVTGHGQGNASNCAEFCARVHTLTVAGVSHELELWRDDCDTTAAPGQRGSWSYARAGWCPGADVRPWVVDLSSELATATEVTIGYDIAPYENSCRPDAPVCSGCTLGTGCAYDGGAHTPPHYELSTLLVTYR
jgi:hypothetical protein